MAEKQQQRAFLIFLISLLLLLALQWNFPHLPFLSRSFKNSRFFTFYLKDNDQQDTSSTSIDPLIAQQLDTALAEKEEKDTLPAIPYAPVREIDEKYFASDSVNIPPYANVEHLAAFFHSLKKEKKKRIGYWGDSMIEGDLITQTLRKKLQAIFGGSGVGYVPMISYTAGFRSTVTHRFDGLWKYFSLVKTPKRTAPYSLAGEYMTASADSTGKNPWVSYAVPGKESSPWQEAYLLYGKGNGKGKIFCRLNKDTSNVLLLKDTAVVNSIRITGEGISRCHFTFQNTGSTPLYGVSFESEEGLMLDNFSLRGNSGMPLTKIPPEILEGFREKLAYRLIILQFGSNVINAQTTDYHWYETAMLKVIRHYQAAFPDASILLLGVADKSIKRDGIMVTDPAVRRVLRLQYKMALKTGVCFFSLFEAMGGENAMTSWVERDKPLANKDYTHFNFRGADKIGNLLSDFIINRYFEFEKDTLYN